MDKNVLDRINMAYKGELGDKMERSSRERIDWMCENVKGNTVLDVGCSQGITSILLGRCGKQVTGIDVVDEQIEYARKELAEESESVNANVEFICGDFANFDFGNEKFNTIIMGECLEHVFNPVLFLDKAKDLLNSEGRLIVTVPFGINPHPDHKRTYYFLELFNQINERICVDSVRFFGGWIGYIADMSLKKPKVVIDDRLVSLIEDAFFKVDERKLSMLNNEKEKQMRVTAKLAERNEEIMQIPKLHKSIDEFKDKIYALQDNLDVSKNIIDVLNKRVVKAENDYRIANRKKELVIKEKDIFNTLLYKEKRKSNRYEKFLEVKIYNFLRAIKNKHREKERKDYFHELKRIEQEHRMEKEKYYNELLKKAQAIPESNGSRFFNRSKVKIGIIADEFQLDTWVDVAEVIYFSPGNYRADIDILLVVSTWHGVNDDWTGLGRPNETGGVKDAITNIIDYHRDKGVKTVFYSKEDPSNYNVFLYLAKKCEYIFTTDSDCISKYIEDTGNKNVHLLPFAINPCIHNPIGFENDMEDEVIFAGTWGMNNKYPERNIDLGILLDGVINSGKKLRIFDRNYYSDNKAYKYPEKYANYVYPPINHKILMKVHKMFKWAININSIKYSDTMFASRVYELQGCGSLMISNWNLGMKRLFPNVFIDVFPQMVKETFERITPDKAYEFQIEGIRRVYGSETIYHRLDYILDVVGLTEYKQNMEKLVLVIVLNKDNAINKENFERQTYKYKCLINLEDLTEEIFKSADMFTYFDEKAVYGDYYIEDMVNGFKYTDSSFITKDSYYRGKKLIQGKRHDYYTGIFDIYRTIFWRNCYSFTSVIKCTPESINDDKGYSIDSLNYCYNGMGV